jgi:hypothetical protein
MNLVIDRSTDAASGEERRDAPALPADAARVASMRRVKRMTLEERIDLFERLSRDAAWARGARRVR